MGRDARGSLACNPLPHNDIGLPADSNSIPPRHTAASAIATTVSRRGKAIPRNGNAIPLNDNSVPRNDTAIAPARARNSLMSVLLLPAHSKKFPVLKRREKLFNQLKKLAKFRHDKAQANRNRGIRCFLPVIREFQAETKAAGTPNTTSRFLLKVPFRHHPAKAPPFQAVSANCDQSLGRHNAALSEFQPPAPVGLSAPICLTRSLRRRW